MCWSPKLRVLGSQKARRYCGIFCHLSGDGLTISETVKRLNLCIIFIKYFKLVLSFEAAELP